jgi:hypothetical protein
MSLVADRVAVTRMSSSLAVSSMARRGGTDLRGEGLGARAVEIADHHAGALGHQPAADGGADAAGSPDDDGEPVRETHRAIVRPRPPDHARWMEAVACAAMAQKVRSERRRVLIRRSVLY